MEEIIVPASWRSSDCYVSMKHLWVRIGNFEICVISKTTTRLPRLVAAVSFPSSNLFPPQILSPPVSIKPTQHTRAIVVLQSAPCLRRQCHDERSTNSACDVAGSTDSRRQSLLLQCPYKSNTMDEADRIDDTGRGKATHPCYKEKGTC